MGDSIERSVQEGGDIFETLRREFGRIARENGLESEEVRVIAQPLTPEEAIGRPEELDYPLLKGKERLMQAKLPVRHSPICLGNMRVPFRIS
jgi:hypothetical protein